MWGWGPHILVDEEGMSKNRMSLECGSHVHTRMNYCARFNEFHFTSSSFLVSIRFPLFVIILGALSISL